MMIKLFSSGDGGGVQHILVLLVLFVAFGIVVAKWVVEIWWKPKCIKQAFEAQGITGPSYKLLVGNLLDIKKIMSSAMASATDRTLSHKIGQRVDSHFLLWSKVFGDPFLFWWGTEPRLAITKSDWMKEVLLNKGGQYEKIALSVRCVTKDIFGDGLAVADGEKWFELRRLFTPFFYVGKIKAMKGVMETSILQLMDDWHEQVERARTSIVEVDVHKELQKLTAEIISRTVFGSSHREGRRIFELQRIQQRLTMEALVSFKLPGYRYLPTASNRLKQKLKKEVHNTLSRIMKNRLESAQHETGPDKFGGDLLGHMLSANDAMSQYGSKKPSFKLSTEDIIDQCKMFFFAGHETTSLLLTWALMLLASNPEWQQRLQAEVDQVCQNEIPDEEALGQLKYKYKVAVLYTDECLLDELPSLVEERINHIPLLQMGMVLQETLRLYPPSPHLSRVAIKDTKLGNLRIPKGTTVTYNGILANRSEAMWGKDADEFRPERFGDADKHIPKAFWPFSLGPRYCIGQGFAMQEAKLALAMVLQRFRWALSPAYRHSPTLILTLHPQHGMPLLLQRRVPSYFSMQPEENP